MRRFSQLLDDLALIVDEARERHPDLPLSLVGHSMGGLVAASFLAERQAPFERAVLSAPALGRGGQPRRMLGGRILRRLRPRHRIPAPFVPEALSTDPAVVDAYLADPFVRHETMTLSLALELLDAMARVLPGEIRVPTLVLHGDDDEVCPPGASEAFAGELPHGKWVRYPGLRHEILNEPSREEVFHEILRWLEADEEPNA